MLLLLLNYFSKWENQHENDYIKTNDFQLQSRRNTRLKRILEETKEDDGEAAVRERMQMLNSQLVGSISNLHEVFTNQIFIATCRVFWDRMGQVKNIFYLNHISWNFFSQFKLIWSIYIYYFFRRLSWNFLKGGRKTESHIMDHIMLLG